MSSRFNEALGIALRFLQSRDRFEEELRRSLLDRGFTEEAEAVLERLRQQGILNDRRTAEAIIRGREGRRAIGTEVLRQQLLQRGAPIEVVEELLEEGDESERAFEALIARHGQDVSRTKAGRFLASRGFSEETIESVLDRLPS